MTTQFFQRPSAGYTGEAGLPNRTKYNDDSTASPRRPISSTKVDGDINYLVDAVNALYDTAVSGIVADNSITDAKLRDSAGLSVIGRSANTTGNPADIVAGTDDQVLRRSGTSIGFGQVATAGIADAAITAVKIADTNVTFPKIQNVNTATLLGRTSSGAGPLESLTVGTGLDLSGGVLSGADASDEAKGIVELATAAETQTGSDDTRAVTPLAFNGSSLGHGQTWQNVTGSRAFTTTYTNTTGRPIVVAIDYQSAGSGSVTLTMTIGGVAVPMACTAPTAGARSTGTTIVQAGATYAATVSVGSTLNSWCELR